MGRMIRTRLIASSIVEVTVAMVIASISFVLAAGFFWQVAVGSLYRQPLKAQQLALSYLHRSLAEGTYISSSLEHEQYQVQRTVSVYPGAASLLLVHIEVMNMDNRLLAEAKQLVYVEAEP